MLYIERSCITINKNIDKKHLILEKAKDMIISDGYGNISINKLTTELGISKGSFYTYFISKDEMLNEILEEYKRETIKFIEYVNEKTNSIQEFIENSLSYSSLFLAEENTLKLEIVMLNLKRNYEILNEETSYILAKFINRNSVVCGNNILFYCLSERNIIRKYNSS